MQGSINLNNRIDISWLIKLRWIAAAAYGLGIFMASFLLTTPLSLHALYSIVAVTLASNCLMWIKNRSQHSFSQSAVGAILLFDTILLTLILYFTGGSANPFSTLFLVHITLAAVLLGPAWTWLLAAFSTACFLSLFGYYIPVAELSGHAMESHHGNASLHLQGMLLAFALTATLISFFLVKVTNQIRKLEADRLDQARLAALTTLAAGAAHELGSPLGTIAIASGELNKLVPGVHQNQDLIDNIAAIKASVETCKRIIERMSGQLTNDSGNLIESFSVQHLVNTVLENLPEKQRLLLRVTVEEDIPEVESHFTVLKSSVSELLKNAFDASNAGTVFLAIFKKEENLTIEVRNPGTSIPEHLIKHVREPFFSTKPVGSGMGLGVFLVDLFAKSMGGTLSIHSDLHQGTEVVLSIPMRQQKGVQYAYAM